MLKLISWAITVALAAAIGDWAIQGSHSVAAHGLCAIRYFKAPAKSYPESSRWTTYGVTQLTTVTTKFFTLSLGGSNSPMNGSGLA